MTARGGGTLVFRFDQPFVCSTLTSSHASQTIPKLAGKADDTRENVGRRRIHSPVPGEFIIPLDTPLGDEPSSRPFRDHRDESAKITKGMDPKYPPNSLCFYEVPAPVPSAFGSGLTVLCAG